MSHTRALAGGLALAALGTCPTPAAATIILAYDLKELVTRSDRVVVAEVVAVESSWDARRERIDTRIELEIQETWKGGSSQKRVTVDQPGGTVDGITMAIAGMPRFVRGERSVLFLQGPPAAAQVVGMAQGKRTLRQDQNGVWIATGGAMGAATVSRDGSGRLRSAAPEPSLPLDELRVRVRGLVGK